VITDPATIQKLALRSDLPRLKGEGFYLFAQLDAAEQVLTDDAKCHLLARAFAALVANEEKNSERPLPALLPRAYLRRELAADWVEVDVVCDLAEPFERRSRAGQVLAVTRHLRGRVRLFRGAFAYFTPDDLTPLESVESTGFAVITA
jgi:hypothetical protein